MVAIDAAAGDVAVEPVHPLLHFVVLAAADEGALEFLE